MSPDRSRPTVVLAAGLRLPQARAGGRYARENAGHLGASLARELLARTGLDASTLDEVIVGCVGNPFDQANVGRVIALRAGVPQQVPARTVARNCASGMEAVTQAATEIEAGRGDTYLCMGVEVMSAYPLVYRQEVTDTFAHLMRQKSALGRAGAFLGMPFGKLLSPRVSLMEGLTDPTCGLIMGKTAENLSRDFSIGREASDAFALESHRRAAKATESGRLAQEMVPHLPIAKKGGETSLDHDDGVRGDQSLDALGKLRPYFEKPDGIVTVGNACGITDGATALLVTTEERARELGLTPLAKIRGRAYAGLDPSRMGLGPVYASALALAEARCTLDDMGAIEVNEAFAVQVLACREAAQSAEFCQRELGLSGPLGDFDPERTNRNGGAIALGHPVGATGARLLLTLAHELRESDSELGLATLCIGGGQGGAVVLERCSA